MPDSSVRETALGFLYWLSMDASVPIKVAEAGLAPKLLGSVFGCGTSARETKFALCVLAALPESAAIPAHGLFKGFAGCLSGGLANESFAAHS